MSATRHPWEVEEGATSRSWHVYRRKDKPRNLWDVEYFVSEGCRRPRRWLKRSEAQTFADNLNLVKA